MDGSAACRPSLCRLPVLPDYFDTAFFETTLTGMLKLLMGHVAREPCLIPFFCSKPGRYRSSVHATCLFSLYKAGCLRASEVEALQRRILHLRTERVGSDPAPAPTAGIAGEDQSAWCSTETPSVWSTGYSVWSLMETDYQGPDSDSIGRACAWLLYQAHPDGGWGYNLYPQTPPTVYLTSLVIKALVHCCRTPGRYGFTDTEVATAHQSISDGVGFILRCRSLDGGSQLPLFHARPPEIGSGSDWDIVSTVWGYQSVLEHGNREQRAVVEGRRQQLFDFLGQHLSSGTRRTPVAFVDEAQTKYQRSRKYMYYQPSLLINLLKIGLSPLHPLAFALLDWLKSTIRADGVLSDYHPNLATTFATALAVQTIHAWTAAISTSVENVQNVCAAARDELPVVRENCRHAQEELELARSNAEGVLQREHRFKVLCIVLGIILATSLFANLLLLRGGWPNLGVGVLGSAIGGALLLGIDRGVSGLLGRRRQRG